MSERTGGWGLRGAFARITALTPLDLALRLTLLDLILEPIGPPWLRAPLLGLACLGLLAPGLLRQPALWWTLAGITGARVALDWPLADNHAYLLSYWCLAIALALGAANAERTLARSAGLLVGLAFAFASLWKLGLSQDYLDGRFFRVALLIDPRFADLAQLLAGPEADLDALRSFLRAHVDAGPLQGWAPGEPASLRLTAQLLTVWTVAIETAVAVAFLWPLGRGTAAAPHALLLLFCATTYAVATVEGFGWLLLAMGVAQCTSPRLRGAYLGVFLLVLFYSEVPWLAWVARLSGSS